MGTTSTIITDSLTQLGDAIGASGAHIFWQLVETFWSPHWFLISFGIIVWIIFEILTRHGGAHFNSKNGFSPTFNRVIGSGVYLLLQAIVYALLHFFFGDTVYTHVWPYMLHLTVFGLTKVILLLVGFWVY